MALDFACSLMEILVVPTAPHKVEGPTTSLTFLGIELDSLTLTACLPEEKLQCLISTLDTWGDLFETGAAFRDWGTSARSNSNQVWESVPA